MGTPGSTPGATCEAVRDHLAESTAPMTAAEVAGRLECSPSEVRDRLDELAADGQVRTKQLDQGTSIWWTQDGGGVTPGKPQQEEFAAFVSAVADYAIFMLDPDGVVASWNEGAGRIKGYDETDIVGQHFSTFYTESDVAAGVPERNLEKAKDAGRIEDEGWRVREDGTRFWANVVITAIHDDDGTLQGFTKVTRDMTERREYEEQLKQERDLTEQILETAPIGICLMTPDGAVDRTNQQLLDVLGVAEADLTGDELWDLYDAADDTIAADEWPWQRVTVTGRAVHDFQCQADLPGIGRRWLSMNAAPIGEAGDDDRVVVSLEDITDQKERERRLRREYDQTQKLLRTAPVAISVRDAAGRTVMANRHAQEAFGLSGEETLSDSGEGWDVYDANGDPVPPGGMPAARVHETGEPVYEEELVVESPDGERLQFSVNAAPLFGSDGSVERVITAAEDISELKRRERQLEQRKAELETELGEILDRISDAFYALDDEWRFTHLNERASELMQQPEAALIGEEIWEAFPGSAEGVYRDHFTTAMDTQEPVSFEVFEEAFDAWLEFNAYPSETGLSVYFHDITERKEYQRRLEESNERLQQFAYAASHDLQEPLRMVSSYLQLIERRYADELDEDGREFIEFAVDGADRMRDMIEALLEYSRVRTQGDPFEPVELSDVLADVREDLQFQIRESGAEIAADSLPRVEGDPSQVRQVFQNLLDNAIEYSGDEPPRVHVATERAGDRWTVSVRDEGIGIESNDTERIFEVFQRLHTHDEHAGTGIGLALCRRIAERHGGDIWVDSEPGEGSTFHVTLPAVGTTE